MDNSERSPERGRSVAVVSEKGGSGKTLLATAMDVELAESGLSVVLVDADLGTGGLTYYLGFSAFSGARDGVADIMLEITPPELLTLSRPTREAQRVLSSHAEGQMSLLPVGDHRRTLRGKEENPTNFEAFALALKFLAEEHDIVIVDCRGGVDTQSLMVCSVVDEILMVVETDAASIKASQYLTDTLSDHGLSSKVAGFILNKVMDDPRALASAGRSFFSTQFLASVPFELETTRDFIRGFLPRPGTLFRKQVNYGLNNLFPKVGIARYSGYMTDQEFTALSTEPPEVKVGRSFVGVVMALTMVAYIFWISVGEDALYERMTFSQREIVPIAFVVIPTVMAVVSLSATLLGFVGRVARVYGRILQR